MLPHTVELHLELIRLLRGCVTAWEKWLVAEYRHGVPFHFRQVVRAMRVIFKAWSTWLKRERERMPVAAAERLRRSQTQE